MHLDGFRMIRFFSIPIEWRARSIASAFQNDAEVQQCVQTYRAGPTYETPTLVDGHRPKSSWYISEMVTLRSNKIFSHAT